MGLPNFQETYNKLVGELLKTNNTEKAMSAAVGGEFSAIGELEYALLLQLGLEKHHTVVDVGCGSGRLSYQLRDYLDGKYIGMDVVKELFTYAERICQRADWSFYEAPGLSIPEKNDSADFICFFSVFTHLLHEESYIYLQDATRVLKPGGKIVLSFLEFKNAGHWVIFEQGLADRRPDKVLNQFISRDGLETWAAHAGLEVVRIYGGDEAFIKLNHPIKFDDGREISGYGSFGQSVCVLTKK